MNGQDTGVFKCETHSVWECPACDSDTVWVCPRHGAVVPCDGDPDHQEGRRLCDPSLPHCPRSNCGKPLTGKVSHRSPETTEKE